MREYIYKYKKLINKSFDENLSAAFKIRDNFVRDNLLNTHTGKPISMLTVPKIFEARDIERFGEIVRVMYGIIEKVTRRFLEDPALRALFPYSAEAKNLILIPRRYSCMIPVSRFDIFYNEDTGDFKFCEINTDGTSAMCEDYLMNKYLPLLPAHSILASQNPRGSLRSFELFDSWIDTFLGIYDDFRKAAPEKSFPEIPRVAIADFAGAGTPCDFLEFKRRFEARGISCDICDISELDPEKYDAVYRRAVTSDILKNLDAAAPLIDAARRGDICLVGSFATQVAHHKWMFKILHDDCMADILTPDEMDFVVAHVPYTALLDEAVPSTFKNTSQIQDMLRHENHFNDSDFSENSLFLEKDRYIIKPLDSYAAHGVFAGCDMTGDDWKSAVLESIGRDMIVQEYCPPYKTENICLTDPEPEWTEYSNMTGLFVYGGKFAGIYSRLSTGGIISTEYNEKSAPSLVKIIQSGL